MSTEDIVAVDVDQLKLNTESELSVEPTTATAHPETSTTPDKSNLVRASVSISSDGSGWSQQWDMASNAINNANVKLTIVVVSPETVSTMMSKHVVYSVKTEPLGYTVRRRYNDFAWLRDTLSNNYVGMYIPSIPSTTIFSTKSSLSGSKTDINGDFVKNRMAQLNQFIQQLCRIPFLRTDPALLAFISVQNEKDFKQYTEASTTAHNKSAQVDVNANEGLRLWLSLVDSTQINTHDADRCISDLKRQLEVLRGTLDLLDKECRLTGKKAVHCANSMGTLSDHINAWNGTETDLLDPNRNEHISAHGTKLRLYMGALATGQVAWAQNAGLVPKVIARVLMSSIQFQLVQVEGFRAYLQQRDVFLKDLERAEKEKVRAMEEKHRAKSSGSTPPRRSSVSLFAKKTDELEEIVQRKTELVSSLQSTVDRVNKGLLFCEIDRFDKERMQSISNLVGSLAATHIQISQAATTKWSEIVVMSGLDTSEFTDCVSGLYTNLDEEEIFGDV